MLQALTRWGAINYLLLLFEDVPLVEFMYLVFTRTAPCESYRRGLSTSVLLCLCDVNLALIGSLVCRLCTGALGLVLFKVV